ncbi:hypothetical protein LC724_19240 [Blautia sp. RD014234]|nr:hypothetical protein [Blautia parvula]
MSSRGTEWILSGGVYAYEKTFSAPEAWKTQDVFLEFEGVYGISRVWVNGALAAVNKNGYVGFWVNLKPWIFMVKKISSVLM